MYDERVFLNGVAVVSHSGGPRPPVIAEDAMTDPVFVFFFNKMPVGQFVDVTAYPDAAGRYRYMPFRGPGHYQLGKELERNGRAQCSYLTPAGEALFVVTARPEHGILVIAECSTPDKGPSH